jgi:hypothetical protein
MTMYLVVSAFTSSPVSLLATPQLLGFLYSTHASSQYNIITINHKLMCTIQFQAPLVYLNPPNGIC